MNKIIKFINKILDVPKLIIRLWIILWLCLIILLIMKFCFGIWYPIVIENKTLLNISDYVNNSWLKYLILFLFYAFNINFVYLIACRKIKYLRTRFNSGFYFVHSLSTHNLYIFWLYLR